MEKAGLRHLMCVISLPRCGTSSVKHIYSSFRSAHEYDEEAAVRLFSDYQRKPELKSSVEDYLRRRWSSSKLEVDSASFHFMVIAELIRLFPDMKFICLYRDLGSWLNSFVKMLFYHFSHLRPQIPEWMTGYGWVYSTRFTWAGIERSFHGHNDEETLALLAELSSFWLKRTSGFFSDLPEGRSIFISTADLSRSVEALERFSELSTGSLKNETHRNAARLSGYVLPRGIDETLRSVQSEFNRMMLQRRV
jgi:hypothetical protein